MLKIGMLAVVAVSLWAQDPANRIRLMVTRSLPLKAEIAVFNVSVVAPASVTLDAVVRAVADIGVKESDLAGIEPAYSFSGVQPGSVSYVFRFKRPYAEVGATLQRIDQVRRALVAANNGMELEGSLAGLTAPDKAREEARAAVTAEAVAQARTRAAELARASGLTLGSLAGVEEFGAGAGTAYPGAVILELTESVTLLVEFAAAH